MSWLRAPLYLLQALAAQIPTLRAGEALQGAAEVAVGTGSMKKHDLDSTLRDWRRTAERGRAPVVAKRVVTAADLEAMGADLGVTIRKVQG